MSTLSTLRNHARLIRTHPALVGWYLRNRVREAELGFECKRPDGVGRFPRGIAIKPTLACNLRCKMCSFASSGDVLADPKETLPLEVWTSMVDEVAPFRPYISLTGGEPLLYPRISELILHIKKRGLFCTVTSNGTMLTKRAPEFMDDPPDVLIISIDGPSEVHDELRGQPGSYERAAAGINLVQALKKERRRRRPLLVINCVITTFNYRRIEEIIDLARELRADALNYQHQWSLTRRMIEEHNKRHGEVHPISCGEVGEIELPPPDLTEVVEVVRRIRRRTHSSNGGTYITFHPDLGDSEVYRWYADPHNWVRRRPPACAWITTNVLPNGDVEPCFGMTCGNITRDKFTSIWNNSAFREHRKRLSRFGDLPVCARCCAYFRRD